MSDTTTADTFTNVANWQGVDSKSVLGSKNLVESGGVYNQGIQIQSEVIDGGLRSYGKSIYVNKGVIHYSDGQPVSSGYFYTSFIPVREGQKITFKGHVSSLSDVAALAAYSSDDFSTYIQNASVKGIGGDLQEYPVYTVPLGVNFIILCTHYIVDELSILIEFDGIKNDINDIQGKIDNIVGYNKQINIVFQGESKPAIKKDGTESSTDYWRSDPIIVKSGDTVSYTLDHFNTSTVSYIARTDLSESFFTPVLIPETSGNVTINWTADFDGYIVINESKNYPISNIEIIRLSTILSKDNVASSVKDFEKLPTISLVERIIGGVTKKFPYTKLPCIAFTFDDATLTTDTLVHDLFVSKGLRCNFAFIASSARCDYTSDYYKTYKCWYLEGFGIDSHSIDGKTMDLDNYTYDTALATLVQSIKNIEGGGIKVNGFFPPSATLDESFKPITAALFQYAGSSSSVRLMTRTSERNNIRRYSIQNNTLADIQAEIDTAITNDCLLVLVGHSRDFNDDGDWNIAKVETVVDYVKAKMDSALCYCDELSRCVEYFYD